MSKTFSDYKPGELVGMPVLFESGSTTLGASKYLCTIVQVTKTQFSIKHDKPQNDWISRIKFNIRNGERVNLRRGGKSSMSTVSQCTLLTEEGANIIKDTWRLKRLLNEFRQDIAKRIEEADLNQLQEIILILNGEYTKKG